MLARGLTAAAGCLLLSIIAVPALAQDQFCDLAAPPANAVVAEDLGHTIYIFPDALPAKFTGCKTWWIETGEKYFIFHLKDGRVTETSMLRENEKKTATCLYPNEALAEDAPEGCMDFSNAQSFAETVMGTADAPKIPAGKDIRIKDPL
jgi:hypothetical protein